MAGVRRKARRVALQALYEIDASSHAPKTALTRILEEWPLPKEGREFAQELVEGVLERSGEIDAIIQRLAPLWPLDQLAIIDRNILRLAIFELLYSDQVPLKSAINEAVELAKTFGSENSSKFVNGVLGAVSNLAVARRHA